VLLASLHHHKPPRRGDTSGEKVRNQSRNADATRYGKSKTHLSHQKAIPRCNTGMRRRREAYRARDSICRAHRGRRERNVQSRLQTWPKGIVSKKLAAPYHSGSGQKSESSGGYTGYRRDFLRARSVSLLGVKRTSRLPGSCDAR
jgi:hypothetical protein